MFFEIVCCSQCFVIALVPYKEFVYFYSAFAVSTGLGSESVHSWCDGSSDRSFMVDPLSYFSFQPVLHDWCNKGHGMCYPVWDDAYKRNLAANWKE